MPDGEATREESLWFVSEAEECGGSGTSDAKEELGVEAEKDPRKIARKYQLELCKKALEENVIVYLGTGCGKTHIAVLLMYESRHLVKAPQKRVCIFLAPTVALVHQQAKVIEDSVDFTVGIHCGSSRHLKSHIDWEKEIEQHEVLVMTPQILLHNLSHSFIKMDFIAVLILDECHHAQIKSSHPYAEIMKVFYKDHDGKLPRIFGMTASPVVGKGASSQENLAKSINSLENLLQAKVYSVENKEELESFVASPVIKVYPYAPAANGTSDFRTSFSIKLEEIKRKCLLDIRKKTETQESLQSLRSTRKMLGKFHDSIMFCLDHLGLWGASQACQILLRDDHSVWNEIVEAESSGSDEPVCNRYLAQVAKVLESYCRGDGVASDLSQVEVLKEPFFSTKILRLVGILSSFRSQPNMKCIVFVNRIVTARSISYILQNLKLLAFWKCDYLVGVHSGVKSMSRKSMNTILENFQRGKLNLLVATKVGEEGLDIQTCCLVIRYDLPETVASFIQSRGRARMTKSEYAFLVNSGDQKDLDLIETFQKNEDRMNVEISSRTSNETFVSPEERVYKISTSGATITSAYSISLLHHYCSKLPHDEYFDPKPSFFYFDDLGGTVCNIILPCNAPIHEVISAPQSSMEAAKRDACLNAIEQLHKLGALNNFLLPEPEIAEENDPSFTHSGCSEDEDPQGEIYEMLVPSVLKQPGNNMDNAVRLYCYFLDFSPIPKDRTYNKFGLFVKASLPLEAERLEIDLHLDRGRSVITKLVPSGMSVFDENEIMDMQNFQEMYLKVILDRSEFVAEYVKLGREASSASNSTFYLLLPVILHGRANGVTVDWNIIRKCLSSPVFRCSQNVMNKEVLCEPHFQLANGSRSVCDIENSLVYVPYQKKFFCVTSVVPGKNAYSPFKSSCSESHMEHLDATFDIHLKYPKQPLLRAKQLFSLRNLLHERGHETLESNEKEEHLIDLVPELCELKITSFSKEIGSSISLLPSIMHRLENYLVAIELKCMLSEAFPEGSKVTTQRVLEALTTENCQEGLSLERLEILGDGFLKFAVARNLYLSHATLDEGELTRRRSNSVNNKNLFQVAINCNLQVFVRDQPFDPCQFFAVGRPCLAICTKETQKSIHSSRMSPAEDQANATEVRCSRGHHWLRKKTIADVVEALVGAFLVDSGFRAATAFLRWIGISVDFDATQVINFCQESCRYMVFSPSVNIVELENSLGYNFLHKGLLLQAFVHPSYNKHGGGCYQRLEFLGDAVLDYAITSYLFSAYPKLKPGHLTDLRSALVNNRAFANIAIERSFQKFIVCDSSNLCEAIEKYEKFARQTSASKGGLHIEPKCPKALGDLVESCMGAILLDTGIDLNKVWKLILSFLNSRTAFSNIQLNPTRELQEICQSHNWDLQFPAEKKGRNFLVEGKLSGKNISLAFSTINSSKREATRIASELMLARLKEKGYTSQSSRLEEILKSSCKMEAKLIGFDESPVDVTSAIDIDFKNLRVQESSANNFGARNDSVSRIIRVSPSEIKGDTGKLPSLPDSVGRLSRENVVEPETDLLAKGACHRGSSRSCLFEICAANHWKPPMFECCHEEGLSHLKSFTFKVILQIEDAEDMVLECFGAPRTAKKAAAEHAAEGALWFLKNEGYLISTDPPNQQDFPTQKPPDFSAITEPS